ncbi:hypothetical protein [Pantoea agglomerans]|uniref:hypothetical protein n=1 Tax=Enterobacter agglomerans TaxID=549 RepID=UPI003207B44B
MSKYAIVKDGLVDNIILWDGGDDWSAPEGCIAVKIKDDQDVGIGYKHDGKKFSSPVKIN